MSHFKVLVIGEDWEEQLAPYEEGATWFEPKPEGKAAKWDWYQMGGRYRGCLLVKKHVTAPLGEPGVFENGPRHVGGVDQARFKDIDWAEMRRRTSDSNLPSLTCYALVKGGEWFEKGEMGWFGMARNESSEVEWQQQLSDLMADLDDEALLTIVDCHI